MREPRCLIGYDRPRSPCLKEPWLPILLFTLIEITGKAGIPPEIYRVTYHINGLNLSPSAEILERGEHIVELNLSLGYPRRAPQCRMLTPIFHPNFDDSMVCIGDFWAASEGLDDLIIRIGRMIAYQEYNTKGPLNGLAAKWAAQNSHLLPVDRRSIAPPLAEASPRVTSRSTVILATPEVLQQTSVPVESHIATAHLDLQDPWSSKIVIESDSS